MIPKPLIAAELTAMSSVAVSLRVIRSLPTRGEYLIRSPGLVKLRPIYLILVLRSPYVVEITADELVAA